ncbi:MAG TPA: hydrolase, partial [bacterium]|nr:hydrolase [bacterium]
SNGVVDLDGALRASDWQLSYQIARSYRNDEGDYAVSVGLWMPKTSWILGLRSRYVGEKFDIQEVGFVPWRGTWNGALLTGPVWRLQTGAVSQVMVYGGGLFNHEKADDYTDLMAALGYNMQFRKNWGFEIEF